MIFMRGFSPETWILDPHFELGVFAPNIRRFDSSNQDNTEISLIPLFPPYL